MVLCDLRQELDLPKLASVSHRVVTAMLKALRSWLVGRDVRVTNSRWVLG